MIKIERMVFNPFQENTYVVYDGSRECIIVDAGCSEPAEESVLVDFISENRLKPVAQVFTHCHLDHILGMEFVKQTWGLSPLMHKASLPILKSAPEQGQFFGVEEVQVAEPEVFIDEGDEVKFGEAALEVVYTPGHADGHICLVSKKGQFVIAGDVLFRDSIGRTDLPTGNFDTLASSIRNKLFTLDKDFVVYPGHGPRTTIGYEMLNNPFVQV